MRVILEIERLLLREFTEKDAPAFYVLGSDPEIIRYTGDPGGSLKSLRHARDVIYSSEVIDYDGLVVSEYVIARSPA